ncbi:hypothetical protein I7I50_09979 [Histoplasma capsulatum G186AR]|nr:hypothetical protein I7I52_01217 [Histoplasma capsulatum]QSS68868.1 hypothetical protein I7I50_09979 [Histoplasma capsulatum G186AR]
MKWIYYPSYPTVNVEWKKCFADKSLAQTRYNFCLFVDDISLESINHMAERVYQIADRLHGSGTEVDIALREAVIPALLEYL